MNCLNFICDMHSLNKDDTDFLNRGNCTKSDQLHYPKNCETRKRYNRIVKPMQSRYYTNGVVTFFNERDKYHGRDK